MARPKAPVSSSSESSDSSDSSSSSEEAGRGSSGEERDLSGQKEQDEVDVIDPKDALLPQFCTPRPVNFVVSPWARRKVLGPFFGLAPSSDEKKATFEKYYCSQEDYKLFSAQTVQGKSKRGSFCFLKKTFFPLFFFTPLFSSFVSFADSPLSMIRGIDNITALSGMTKVQNEIMFAVRIGLRPYENLMDQQVNFGPGGRWVDAPYNFGQAPFIPTPVSVRENITDEQVRNFLNKGIFTNIQSDEQRMAALAKYAISYQSQLKWAESALAFVHDVAKNVNGNLQEIK